MTRRVQLVDVFGQVPYSGNPLAVVLDSSDLSDDALVDMTRWFNLSETSFVLPPSSPLADYRVRIFTLDRELPFAGHPTLGSCHAWLAAGGIPRSANVVVQECGAGLVTIRRDGSSLAFGAPPLVRSGPVDDDLRSEIAAVLRVDSSRFVDAAWIDNGPGWVGVLLDSAAEVLAIEPAASSPRRWDIGVIGPYPPGSECAYEVRALFSDHTGALREDPVTGSLNASLAEWMLAGGRAKAPYTAAQGARLGRRGRIHVTTDETGRVWIGGSTVTMVSGIASAPPCSE